MKKTAERPPRRRRAPEGAGKKEYVFTFSCVPVSCKLDKDEFTEEDRRLISDYLGIASKEVCIDKTYVDFKGTKYRKTFMSEDGWDRLCEFVSQTDGKRISRAQKAELVDTYRVMIACYLYQLMQEMGYDQRGMYIEVGKQFAVKVEEDATREWERYPGDWRTWDPSLWEGLP